MSSGGVRRRICRVRRYVIRRIERKVLVTEATTQVGSWTKLFNEIETRDDVRQKVMEQLVKNPDSGAADFLKDLKALNLSPEEYEQKGLEKLKLLPISHMLDLYALTLPLE